MNEPERYTTPTEATDLTEEILDLAREASDDGWYPDGKIDWEGVWDRIEGTHLADGTILDMGNSTDSPAMRKIQRTIRAERREG